MYVHMYVLLAGGSCLACVLFSSFLERLWLGYPNTSVLCVPIICLRRPWSCCLRSERPPPILYSSTLACALGGFESPAMCSQVGYRKALSVVIVQMADHFLVIYPRYCQKEKAS